MPRLLLDHHAPSPAMHSMFTEVRSGAERTELEGVDVIGVPGLSATALDVLDADAYLLGTPANLGYMSGALKHFFDQIYYPCLESTAGRPYGIYVHGNTDTDGAIRAIQKICVGLGWRLAQEPISVLNEPTQSDLDACREFAAAIAAGLVLGGAKEPPAIPSPAA